MDLPQSVQLLRYFLDKSNVESELNNEGLKILRDISVKEGELKAQYTLEVEFKKDVLVDQIKGKQSKNGY